jgi:glycosyltransferase involved in cell wall biosynthesis
MKISGFSYIRNGFRYGYPFLQSIQSILPVCDEFVIAVGNSEDGTREAIVNLGNPKIRIVDTVWDEQLRENGKVFAAQANIALRETTGDWAFHIQADEVIHESDLQRIEAQIQLADNDQQVEGFILDFLNFHGSYNYLNDTRYQHRTEVRIFRNHLNIYSYRDSQGFRRYPSYEEYLNQHKGFKINVKAMQVPVYHYSYVRNPEQMNLKSKYFETFYHEDGYVEKKYQDIKAFDYYNIERVKRFTGQHPALMKEITETQNWDFDASKIHRKLPIKDRLAYPIEDIIRRRIGEWRNYNLI